MIRIGEIIQFRDWNGKVLEGTITEITNTEICVDVDDTDYWILEEEILYNPVL